MKKQSPLILRFFEREIILIVTQLIVAFTVWGELSYETLISMSGPS